MSDRPEDADPDETPDPAAETGDAEPTDADAGERKDAAERESEESTGERATRYLYLGALGVLVVLAAVGLFGFYTSTNRIIQVWVADQYRPIFSAAFNLVVLLAAGAGIARLAPLVREG